MDHMKQRTKCIMYHTFYTIPMHYILILSSKFPEVVCTKTFTFWLTTNSYYLFGVLKNSFKELVKCMICVAHNQNWLLVWIPGFMILQQNASNFQSQVCLTCTRWTYKHVMTVKIEGTRNWLTAQQRNRKLIKSTTNYCSLMRSWALSLISGGVHEENSPIM